MREKEKIVYRGKLFKITESKVQDKDGITHTIERCSRPDVVTVIGITKDNKLVMIEEFRPGSKKHTLWLPGGRLEENEDPKIRALQEFEEETSYTTKELTLFHMKSPSDSFASKGYVYVSRNVYKNNKSVIGDESGNIKTVLIPLKEAIDLALNGDIRNEFFCYLILKLGRQLQLI